jgi:hypothetical protein
MKKTFNIDTKIYSIDIIKQAIEDFEEISKINFDKNTLDIT